jgi:hypothetical protein
MMERASDAVDEVEALAAVYGLVSHWRRRNTCLMAWSNSITTLLDHRLDYRVRCWRVSCLSGNKNLRCHLLKAQRIVATQADIFAFRKVM